MQKLNSYFADFKQVKEKVGYFVNNTVSQATFGYLPLSTNVNEAIRAILNHLFYFFYKKISHTQKAQKA